MIDPQVSLAFALRSNPGAYAALIGSGVSVGAGIPTGWHVVLDLISQLARVLGENPGDDLASWYQERFGEEPDYSKLLDALAKSPAERSALLRSYFEPTLEDRSRGTKVPGAAHMALAELAASGHIQVFVTTNFDRLIEQALEAVGVTPRVLSTPDSILGSPPLSQAGCTVLKLHGDYLDTRIKNTPAELDSYDEAVDGLLDRIINDHGFIVCGWSAAWDTALRRAFERSKSRSYTTYWADVVPPGEHASHLIEVLEGDFIQVKGADDFFTGIVTQVKSLDAGAGAGDRPKIESTGTGDDSELPTGIITYLFTDVEGSTRLWQQYPEEMKTVMASHDALLGSIVDRHGGVVVRSRGEGDSLFSVFASASDSVAAACDMQQTLLHETWPADIPIRVRMSLNTGEAELREHDYYGTAVNRCARLRSIAHAGQVVVSSTTAGLVRDTLPEGTSLLDLGFHSLKDLPGTEQIFQVLHPDLPSEFPPLKSPDTSRNNLPVQVTSFVGRESETSEITDLLTDGPLVTLTGSGGSGKSRLAQESASSNLDAYPDGVWLVALAPLSDPRLIAEEASTVLGVGEDALYNYLEEKTALLILDNCEHMIDGCAEFVGTVLQRAPNVRVLATSQEALGIPGETVYRVPSLSVPDSPESSIEVLAGCTAVSLFVERAAAVQPGFALTVENAVAITQITRSLDGIPLAIELAAARTSVLSAEQIADRIDDSLRLLNRGRRTDLPRHQTLRGVVEWSYQLLAETDRLLFDQLSVFRGGFTLEAAEEVCSGDDLDRYEVLDVLSQLVDKSLVVFEEGPEGESRYRLLETLRLYTTERLAEKGQVEAVSGRHAAYFLAMLERAQSELFDSRQVACLNRLESDYDNFRAAMGWALESDDGETALKIASDLTWFWIYHRHVNDGQDWMQRVVLGSSDASPKVRAIGLARASVLHGKNLRDFERLNGWLEESLRLCQEAEWAEGTVEVLYMTGVAAWFEGEYERMGSRFEDILPLLNDVEDTPMMDSMAGLIRYFLGSAAASHGDNQQADSLMEQGLVSARKAGGQWLISYMLLTLGARALDQGDYEKAESYYNESLPLFHDVNDLTGVACTVAGLGTMAWLQGDHEQALSLHRDSLTNFRDSRLGSTIGFCLEAQAGGVRPAGGLQELIDRHNERLDLPAEEWSQAMISDAVERSST